MGVILENVIGKILENDRNVHKFWFHAQFRSERLQ
jgi:hypothetical protein